MKEKNKEYESAPGMTLYEALSEENKNKIKYYDLAIDDLCTLRDCLSEAHRFEIELALNYMLRKKYELMLTLYCEQEHAALNERAAEHDI